ncbi:hypothetical protein TIFTF001_048061 [Ficus carica]|uniref:Uncharacterized protein n=1 Tax=Ficus carica TaxID=3494 RepID=A0AA88CQP2_FICCA|nr:hypothetical protein TIFTF001_048061 [Ficus carica]
MLVAIDKAYMDCVPTDIVHGISLEAVSGFVAWPKRITVIEMSLSQASRGPSHIPDREVEGNKRIKKIARKKKLQSQPEVQQQTAQQQLPPFNFSEIPYDLRPLAYHAQCSMLDVLQIACPTQQSISGNDMPLYISYLTKCCEREGVDQRFRLFLQSLSHQFNKSGKHWILTVIDP